MVENTGDNQVALNRNSAQDPDPSKSWRKTFLEPVSRTDVLRGTAGIFVTFAILHYLFSYLSFSTFRSILLDTRPFMLLTATLIYLCIYIVRSYRFSLMFHRESRGFLNILAVVSLHTVFNHVLPFRTGELSYLYYQKHYNQIPYSYGSASLLTARILDILCLILWGAVFWGIILMFQGHLGELVVLYLFLAAVCSVIFVAYQKALRKTSARTREEIPVSMEEKDRLVNRALVIATSCLRKMSGSLLEILGRTAFSGLFLSSMIIWFLTFLYFFTILLSLGNNMTFIQSLPASYGAILGNLLPVNGIGSIGTFEAGMALGQKTMGASGELSVSLAFLVHGHAIITGAITAVPGWIYLKKRRSAGKQRLRA